MTGLAPDDVREVSSGEENQHPDGADEENGQKGRQ